MAIPSATRRVKTSSRLRRTGSIATGPASNYSVNSNASSATPTAPRWYLPAIWGVLYSSRAESPLGEPEWGISQTPQVWIDHLAFEHHGEVWLQWDSNDALFLRR